MVWWHIAVMIPLLAVCIPIIGIIGGILSDGFNNWLKHRERKRSGVGSLMADEVAALREEVAKLRSTSTQYDMSLQQLLEHMSQRIDNVESRLPSTTAQPRSESQHVRTGQ